MNNYRNLLNIVLINISLLLIGILIIELVFGSWLSSYNNLYHLKILIDKRLVYNLEGLYETENDVIHYSRDKFGLRGSYDKVRDIDILTIGGSTTDQRYITDGSTWQDVLQKSFESEGEKIIVANAGVDGQSTYGHIKNFNMWFNNISDLKPQYYLFFIGVNDFYKNEDYFFDDLQREIRPGIINKIKIKIKNESILYHLYGLLKNIKAAQDAGLVHRAGHVSNDYNDIYWVKEALIKNHEKHIQDRLSGYRERLEILCQKVHEKGATPIFVTQSARRLYRFVDGQLYGDSSFKKQYDGLTVNAVDYYHMISLFNGVTKKVSKRNNAIFLDLDSELEFDLEKDFYDYVHHTPSGSKKVGEYLFIKLIDIIKNARD